MFGSTFESFDQPPTDFWDLSIPFASDIAGGTGMFLISNSAGNFSYANWVGAVLPTPDGYAQPIVGEGISVGIGIGLGVGDFTGDGWPDLMLLNNNGAATVVPFDGTAFAAPIPLGDLGPIGAVFSPVGSFIDLDGDGKAEPVGRSGTRLRVRWSSRAPADPWQEIEVGFSFDIEAIADLTGDGIGDILVRRSQSNQFALVPGTNTDALGEPIVFTAAANTATAAVTDISGDGLPDIVLATFASYMLVMVNEGDGVFTTRTIDRAAGVQAIKMIGDIDADGRPDAIVKLYNNNSTQSDWIWSDPFADEPSELKWFVSGRLNSGRPSIYGNEILARDMNADGLADLVRISGSLSVDYQIQNAPPLTGTRLGARSFSVPRRPTHVLPIELNADGAAELVVTSDRSPSLYRRDTAGKYTEEDLGGAAAFMSVTEDFNADGRPDLLVSARDGFLDFYPGTSAGGFGPAERIALPTGAVPLQIATGDLNADGVPDAVTADDALAAVHVILGQAGATPGLAATVTDDAFYRGIAIIDIDADGSPEIVVGETEPSVRVLRGAGDAWVPSESIGCTVPPYWLTGADFDADGFGDVFVGTWDSSRPFRILYGSPAGLATHEPWFVGTGGASLEAATADLDGNGLLDLLVAFDQSVGAAPSPRVYLQTSPRTFDFEASLTTGEATGVALADLNADGVTDAVSVGGANTQPGSLRINYGPTPAPCPADLDASGQLNFFDLLAYLALYNDQAPGADLAEPSGTINFFDLLAYLGLFNAGCP